MHSRVAPCLLLLSAVLASCSDDGSSVPPDGQIFGELGPLPDYGVLPSGPLPTIVNLDWNAFPKDPGPDYPVSGRTWVVKTGGNDSAAGTDAAPLRTIVKALQRAAGGDKVLVHGGSYNERWPEDFRALIISKPLVLTAAAGAPVTVTSSESYGISIESSNVVVNGINLTGFTYAIQIGSSTPQKNVVISNLRITATGTEDEGIVAYDPGTPATSDGLLIKNVTITGVQMGVSCNVGPCRSWRLENVRVVGAGGSGSGADAIAVEKGDNFLFYGVDVSNVAADGIDTKATRVVVWNCHVHDLQRNGVKLWRGGDVVNTRIHHTGADAAVVGEYQGTYRLLHTLVAYHNKGGDSSYNATFGYDSQEALEIQIVNSIFYNHASCTYFNDASTVLIDNSIFFGMDDGQVVQKGSKVVTLSDGPAALNMGSDNQFVDPMLTADFHLQAGSPAGNKAKTLGASYPTTDCLGRPRIKGDKPDIGPFEDL